MYAWLFVILIFIALIMVGIKYEKIVPPAIGLIRSKRLNPWFLLMGLFLIFMSLIPLSQEPGFINLSPGAQSSERWGVPVHNRLLFAVGFICGILSLIAAFRKSSKVKIDRDALEKICVTCGTIFNSQVPAIKSCSKCGGNVENISGVMDRHPDLIETIKKNS
jgi:hypothetical protein